MTDLSTLPPRHGALRAVLEEVREAREALSALATHVPSTGALEADRSERQRRLEAIGAHLRDLRPHLDRLRRSAEAGEAVPEAVAQHLRSALSLLLEAHWLARRAAQRGRTAARLLESLEEAKARIGRSADAVRALEDEMSRGPEGRVA